MCADADVVGASLRRSALLGNIRRADRFLPTRRTRPALPQQQNRLAPSSLNHPLHVSCSLPDGWING